MGGKGKHLHLLMVHKKQMFNQKRIACLSEERDLVGSLYLPREEVQPQDGSALTRDWLFCDPSNSRADFFNYK